MLRQALTHSSFLNEQEDSSLVSYDRLEYLGDAFLGWVVARELYASYPRYDEGDLSRARAALIRGETLAEIAQQFDLGAYLFLSQGEESGGGRSRTRNLADSVGSRPGRSPHRPGRAAGPRPRHPVAGPANQSPRPGRRSPRRKIRAPGGRPTERAAATRLRNHQRDRPAPRQMVHRPGFGQRACGRQGEWAARKQRQSRLPPLKPSPR